MPISVSQSSTPPKVALKQQLGIAALIWWGAALIAICIDPSVGRDYPLLFVFPPAAHAIVTLLGGFLCGGSMPGLILWCSAGAVPLLFSLLMLIASRPAFVWSYATVTAFSLSAYYLWLGAVLPTCKGL